MNYTIMNQCHEHRLKRRRRRSTFSTLLSTIYSSSSTSTILLLILTTITTPQYYTIVNAQQSCDPCITSSISFIQIPDTNCEQFVQCSGSKTVQTFTCQSGLIYDANLSQCNWASQVTCGPDPVCPTPEPTNSPTVSPTASPPTFLPTTGEDDGASAGGGRSPSSSSSGQQPPFINPYSPTSKDAITIPSSTITFTAITPIRYPHHSAIWAHINANKLPISNTLLRHNYYSYMDFYRALRSMSEQGYAVPVEEDDNGEAGGEIIDEFGNRASWQRTTFYLGEHIITPTYTAGDAAVIGLVNIALFVSQSMSSSVVYGLCDEVDIIEMKKQQLDGSNDNIQPSNENMNCPTNERHMECSSTTTDNNNDNVSYHGRGTLLTRGQCQYGKLDYYLGSTAHSENRPSRYPELNFCSEPSSICSSSSTEIQWITGLFTWIDSIQSYNDSNWNYVQKLHEFVAGGMLDVNFIYEVSSLVVTQGDSISSTEVENNDVEQRWKYFLLTLDTFGIPRPVGRQS